MFSTEWTPGLEMNYSSIKPFLVYSGKRYIPLPRGDKAGYGNILFYLCPSQEDTIQELQSDYLRWFLDMYRHYTTDTIFREKIGKTRVMTNMTQVIRRDWDKTRFDHPLRYVAPLQRKTKLKDRPNVIVDLGEWHKFYFNYSLRVSIPVIVKNYINFLATKLNSVDWNGYTNKIVYIPINRWFGDVKNELGFKRNQLNNPLAIILFAIYKYPELFALLPKLTYIFGDSENDQFVFFNTEDMTKKNFQKIKMRLKAMRGFSWDEESEQILDQTFTDAEEDQESELNNKPNTEKYEDTRNLIKEPDEGSSLEEKAKEKLKQENRTRLINDMKRSLVGPPTTVSDTSPKKEVSKKTQPSTSGIVDTKVASAQAKVGNKITPKHVVEDLTKSNQVYDQEDIDREEEDTTPISLNDDELDTTVVDAVDDALAKMEDEDPDVLLNHRDDFDVERVERKVREKVKNIFVPDRNDEQLQRMREYQAMQDKIIPQMPTAKQIKSKVIDTSDFSNVVKTSNPAIVESKFVNFDRDYTEKKLPQDIDNAVAALSNASVKVYVVNKTEEDTSDQLNLKKTITYTLKDEYGGKHTITLDIPIIVDDKYIYCNGSKMLLGHQEIMMPIVKSGPSDVQIVTWYNKLTVHREGVNDTRTDAVKRYMDRHNAQFQMKFGNAMAKNHDMNFDSTLDIDMYAKQMMGFHIGDIEFILDQSEILKKGKAIDPKIKSEKGHIPVAIDNANKRILYVDSHTTLTDLILDNLSARARNAISANTKPSAQKLLRSNVKIMSKYVPLILLLFFYEGFTKVMNKAHINYEVRDIDSPLDDVNMSDYDVLRCEDKAIIWQRNPIWNTMLMNGLNKVDLSIFSFEELDDPNTYANILANYFTSRKIIDSLMQYYDFMIDPATKEILEDYELPTDLVSLLLLANQMLSDNSSAPINDAHSFRIRSNEIIAEAVYNAVTRAYGQFRATQNKMGRNKKPDRINVKPNTVITEVTRGSSLTNEASVLNPILELEKARAVTPRGPRGVGKPRAMTLEKRAYDPTMLGIIGVTTSPDANVGVNRQLTLEPNITSTRGYTKITDKKDLQQLSNANLLTPSELLSPPGVLHDDGPRIGMSYKQSQYMLPIEGSTPVFFGNKAEEVVPYHLSREFVITAKQDGEVVEIKDGVIVVRYKDGTYDSINTNPKMKKNASSGFFIKIQLKSSLTEVGQKFKKNEVIGQDPRAFTKQAGQRSAAMNIGVPVKVAIIPNYDIYEDAGPITSKLSEKFTTYMSMKEEVGIPAQSYVEKMVNVGDKVKVGDPLIIYDPAHDDAETNAFFNEIRSKLGDELSDLVDLHSMPQVRTEYAGTISEIEVFTSVPLNELSPSLQKIVKKYTAHSSNVVKLLDKYKNEKDTKYYKCGQLITNAPEVVKPDYENRVKGVEIGNDGKGVVIFFYIEFKDIAKTGDKGSAFTALKFTTSHVIDKGLEAYSEYRPDEEISTFIAPGAVLARKTPSIQVTMFTNKCIIEMKRHALDIFFNDADPNSKK